MNSQMLLMFAKLQYGKKFEITGTLRNFNTFWSWHQSHRANITKKVSIVEDIWTNKTIVKFAIVRDPIDRFISAFLQFCVLFPQCHKDIFNNCHANPICILDLVDSINEAQNWTKYGKEAPIAHFAPQYTQCFFRQRWNDYLVITYENSDKFRQLVRDTLIERGVPVEFLQSGWGINKTEWLGELTMHQTSVALGRMRKQLLENGSLVLRVYETYRKDYDFLNFSLPKIVTPHVGKNGEMNVLTMIES